MLIVSGWPKIQATDTSEAKTFEEIKAIVEEIRFISTTLRLHNANLYYTNVPFLTKNAGLIKLLAGLEGVQEVKDGRGLYLTTTPYKCWLDVDQETAKAFIERLEAKKTEQGRVVERLEARLSNKTYVEQAPKTVVDETKGQLKTAQELLAKISTEYDRFNSTQT